MLRFIVLLILAFPALAAPPTGVLPHVGATDSAESLLEVAEAKFDAAVARYRQDRVLTPSLFREAAAAYAALRTQGIENVPLLLNTGNAWMLAGDTARAVLAYRRAERLRPFDREVQVSLAAARSRVGIEIKPSAGRRFGDTLVAWRGHVPRSVVVMAGLGAYAGLWLCAAARFTPWRRFAGRRLAVAFAVLASLCLVMTWVDHRLSTDPRQAVVVAPAGANGRNGPSAGVYDLSFDQPLPPGVELTILEEREGWCRVRLLDGRESWLESWTLERV